MQSKAEQEAVTLRALAGLVGFKLESFGGNTGAFIRPAGPFVDCLTTAGDSFPPAGLLDHSMLCRYRADDWQAWESGELENVEAIATIYGTARELLEAEP